MGSRVRGAGPCWLLSSFRAAERRFEQRRERYREARRRRVRKP